VREEVIFQVPEKRNFDAQNQFQMILLNVWRKDFTKKITRSPVSGAVLTFCSPKKLLFLQKSLFLDGAHVQIINLFIKKITHCLSKLPQPYCRLFVSPLSSLPAAYQPPRFIFLGGI
jgi:hypothetical protein